MTSHRFCVNRRISSGLHPHNKVRQSVSSPRLYGIDAGAGRTKSRQSESNLGLGGIDTAVPIVEASTATLKSCLRTVLK